FLVCALLNPRDRTLIPGRRSKFVSANWLVVAKTCTGLLTAFQNAGLKPIELPGQIALDVGDMHGDDPVATLLQPRLPRGAVVRDDIGLVGVDQLDRDSVHEGDKIRNVPADRGLAFEFSG